MSSRVVIFAQVPERWTSHDLSKSGLIRYMVYPRNGRFNSSNDVKPSEFVDAAAFISFGVNPSNPEPMLPYTYIYIFLHAHIYH